MSSSVESMEKSATKSKVATSASTTKKTTSKKLCAGFASVAVAILVAGIIVGLRYGIRLAIRSKLNNRNLSVSRLGDATTASCGGPYVQPSITARIANADVSRSHSWPWTVAIYLNNGRFCGGTLISFQHVLTAAHCVFDVTSDSITVHAGIQRLSERFTSGQARTVSSMIIHPNYSDPLKLNDLAVLKLASPITKTNTVGLCCLSATNTTSVIDDLPVFVGWGRTTPTSNLSDELRQATVHVVDRSFCNFTSMPESKLCAGNTSSVACGGADGGPLMMKVNNLWTLIGVMNLGLSTCDGYVAYTKVDYYYGFISNSMSQ